MKTKKKTKRDWKNEKHSSDSSASDDETHDQNAEEHDLTDFTGNSIKLMTEIFKILGDKKLKQMVPSILKPIDMNDLKACLVEESMALSKKRLVSILNGEPYSSSSESEDEDEENSTKKPSQSNQDFDVISLDGISDDSDIFCFDELPEAEILPDIKKEIPDKIDKKKFKKGKKHKTSEVKKQSDKPLTVAEEKAMTALELLELQARARAIKSQLALESVTSPVDNVDEEIKEEIKNETSKTLKENDNIITKSTSKKVKLRRDHLRIDPNRTNFSNKQKEIENQKTLLPSEQIASTTSKESDIAIPEENIKKERRSSSDSLILESPSHPLIVISSEDEKETSKILTKEKNSNKSDKTFENSNSTQTEDKTSHQDIIEADNNKYSSSEEDGEISNEESSTNKSHPIINQNKQEQVAEKKDTLVENPKTVIILENEKVSHQENTSVNENSPKSNVSYKSNESDETEKTVDQTKSNSKDFVPEDQTKKNKKSTSTNLLKKSKTVKHKNTDKNKLPNKTSDSSSINNLTATEKSEENVLENRTIENTETIIESTTATDTEKPSNEVEINKSLVRSSVEKDSLEHPSSSPSSDNSTNIKNTKPNKINKKHGRANKSTETLDDCIIIDSEPEFDSEPEETINKSSETETKDVENSQDKLQDEGNVTWKERWLGSKKVKSVLQTSKLCNNIKRKISSKKDQAPVDEAQTPEVTPITSVDVNEGSIQHFNALSKNNNSTRTEKIS